MCDETDAVIGELKRATDDRFSETELRNFITMGKQLAGKTVLTALIKLLGDNNPLAKKIKKRIPYDYSGYVQCVFKEIQYVLCISLSVVPRAYKTDIDIPSADYAQDLFTKYDFLKNTAVAFWRQFVEENPRLYTKLVEALPGVNLSTLTIDSESPTTMYFDPESAQRIGIFCYYVDSEGRPLYKRGSQVEM